MTPKEFLLHHLMPLAEVGTTFQKWSKIQQLTPLMITVKKQNIALVKVVIAVAVIILLKSMHMAVERVNHVAAITIRGICIEHRST